MSLELRAHVPERGVALDLAVAAGQTLALIGPNGAGKSTALSLISGALRPASGEITLDGRVLTGDRTWVPPHRRRVTTLSQDPVLFPHLTVLGNIRFALRSQGVPRARARLEAERRLAELGIPELASRRPAQLSGGQAQRVAVARALAADPRLLLLDEPMAALDIDVAPALREQLRRFLVGRTAIIVTHDVLDALTLADRVAVLEKGRVLEQGPTLEVLDRPRSDFSARFAGLNLLRGTWDGQAVRLDDGARIAARSGEPLAVGSAVLLAVRPSAVTVRGPGAPADGATPLRRRVRSLEPLGDLVRVRAEGIAADVPPRLVAGLHLEPGAEVELLLHGRDAIAYPAR